MKGGGREEEKEEKEGSERKRRGSEKVDGRSLRGNENDGRCEEKKERDKMKEVEEEDGEERLVWE